MKYIGYGNIEGIPVISLTPIDPIKVEDIAQINAKEMYVVCIEESNSNGTLIVLDNLGLYTRGRLWINCSPDISYDSIKVFEDCFDASSNTQWNTKELTLELAFPRHASNYALLGVKYEPNSSKKLSIRLYTSDCNGAILTDQISILGDEVHMGIPEEFTLSIMNTIKDNIQELKPPSGTLIIDIGAHGYVGSSQTMFAKVTLIIMRLLSINPDKTSVEEYKQLVLQEIRNLQPKTKP